MKNLFSIAAALVLTGFSTGAFASDEMKSKAVKPPDSSGWVVVQEDFFYPLRFEPSNALHQAAVHFRRTEEKAAARELRSSAAWLRVASGHALPLTHESLVTASSSLDSLASDLEKGNIVAGRALDQAIAKAQHALAEWHYFKAKEKLGKDEEQWAALDLERAASYLRDAAVSSHSEYGSATWQFLEGLDHWGTPSSGAKAIDHDALGRDLDKIETEIKSLAKVLKGTSK